MNADSYASYGDWKEWDAERFMQPTEAERNYYSDELRGAPIAGRKVLEIGFGNGNFLRWAADHGAMLYGTEILPDAIARAQAAGVEILPLDLAEALPKHSGSFAIVAAFDVMEHLTVEQSERLLDQAAALLEPGGLFVARFPNGQSPLGRVYQHGDLTHLTVLSAAAAQQMLIGRPFDIVHVGNPAPTRFGGIPRRLVGRARAGLQRLIERLVCKLYDFRAPLGLNTVLVARRR